MDLSSQIKILVSGAIDFELQPEEMRWDFVQAQNGQCSRAIKPVKGKEWFSL